MRQLRGALTVYRSIDVLVIFSDVFINGLIVHLAGVLVSLLNRLSELHALEDALLVAGAMLLRLVVSAHHSQIVSTEVRLHLS